jgi:hypothetical protein
MYRISRPDFHIYKFLIITIIISFIACDDESKIIKNAHEIYNQRKQKFLDDKKTACQRELMAKAESIADSTLITLINSLKKDSLYIPTDTIRPVKPDIQFPNYKKPEKPDTTIQLK